MLSATLSKSGLGLVALLFFGGIETLPAFIAAGLTGHKPLDRISSGDVASRALTNPMIRTDPMMDDAVTNAALHVPMDLGRLHLACAYNAMDGDQVVTGDKIALRVFENTDGGAERFERRDLSGTFTVDAKGAIAVPGVGRLTVAEQALACLEAPVAAAFDAEMGVSATVTASFVSRPSVLIKGAVIAPGSYQHSPDLTLGALVAKAGAGGGTADTALRRTLAARQDELGMLRAELVLRHARLSAQRVGAVKLILPEAVSPELVQQLGKDRLEGEEAVLEAALAEKTMRAARDAGTRESLESSLQMATVRRDLVRGRYDDLTHKRDALERLVASDCIGRCGSARKLDEQRLENLSDRLADLDLTLQAAETFVVEARQAVDRHQRDVSLDQAEAENALAVEVAMTLTRRNEIDAQIGAINAQLADLRGGTNQEVRVERRSSQGMTRTFVGHDSLRLLPGDIVTVGRLVAPPLTLADGSRK